MTEEPTPARKLVGYVAADADVDDVVDAILATVPANERPPEDRENRLPKPEPGGSMARHQRSRKKAPEDQATAAGFVEEAASGSRPPTRRKLITFFPADASSEAIADAIIAALPPEHRPVDDPARIAWEEARKDDETKP
jgi:hypothetical protein